MRYLILLLLAGCAKGKEYPDALAARYSDSLPSVASFIDKKEIIYQGGETTPIVFDNQVYLIVIGNGTIDVRTSKGELVSQWPAQAEYLSAFVESGVVYVFSTELKTHDKLSLYTSNDLRTWSAPKVVLRDQKFFNSSVTKGPNGYVMALEVLHNDMFITTLWESSDLVNWRGAGSMFPDYYCGAPTIRYADGYYYVFYTTESRVPEWEQRVARSKDLINWIDSKLQVIAAKEEPAGNASDLDFVEFNGEVFMMYLNTPQDRRPGPIPNVGARKAVYPGSLNNFMKEFF